MYISNCLKVVLKGIYLYFIAVCPPGQRWEPCAFKCDKLCEGFAMTTGMCRGDNPCVPMCITPATKPVCGVGELLKDKNTCVKQDMCPCLKPDGTVAQVIMSWVECSGSVVECLTQD